MAQGMLRYRGMMLLVFYVVTLLGVTEQTNDSQAKVPLDVSLPLISDAKSAEILLRVLTPVIKAVASKEAIKGLAECMESLGGVGYLENEDVEINIARLFRDANVLSIWEGTTDVLAADLVKVLKGRRGEETLQVLRLLVKGIGGMVKGKDGFAAEKSKLQERYSNWETNVNTRGMEALMYVAREVMLELGEIVAGVLVLADAERDEDEVAGEVARRWLLGEEGISKRWNEVMMWDRRIVFGDAAEVEKVKL